MFWKVVLVLRKFKFFERKKQLWVRVFARACACACVCDPYLLASWQTYYESFNNRYKYMIQGFNYYQRRELFCNLLRNSVQLSRELFCNLLRNSVQLSSAFQDIPRRLCNTCRELDESNPRTDTISCEIHFNIIHLRVLSHFVLLIILIHEALHYPSNIVFPFKCRFS